MTVFSMCADKQHDGCMGKRKVVELGTMLDKWESCSCFCHTSAAKRKAAMNKRLQKMRSRGQQKT